MEIRLPDPDAICASPHGKMFREHQGSSSSDSKPWKVRRQCKWHHFAGDIFIEGAALVVGFSLMQSILLYHTGYLHSVEGLLQQPEHWDFLLTSKILGWSAVFGILVPVVAKSSAWLPGFCATDSELLRESCSAALAWCLVRGAALAVRPHCSVMDTYIVVAFPLTWLAFVVTGFAYGMPSRDMEVSHSIANAFGIVMGLAWDKAFESLVLHITAGWYGHHVVNLPGSGCLREHPSRLVLVFGPQSAPTPLRALIMHVADGSLTIGFDGLRRSPKKGCELP